MSSWLARTISSTLDLDDPHKEDQNDVEPKSQTADAADNDDSSSNRGVKEDLSELTNTLSKQFWGVASFLAPSPSLSSGSGPHPEGSDPEIIPGIRNDFAEIGGRFKTGISKLSDNVASVSEITKMASTFLQLGSDDDEEENQGVFGVTDAVVAFVDDITMHPDTWLDFPLPDDDEDDDQDFVLSNAQQEHALAIERLVPRLAALRMEFCPGYMSESHFWKIYFILLHPRLEQHDAEVLSTSQIVEARALLTHNMKKAANVNPEQDQSSRDPFYVKASTNSQEEEELSVPSTAELQSVFIETSASELVDVPVAAAAPEIEKHPIISSEIQIVDKSVIEEDNVKQKKDINSNSASASKIAENIDEDDADDWLKEESQSSEIVGSKGTKVPIVDDDDVSFSDLEEDEEDVPKVAKK